MLGAGVPLLQACGDSGNKSANKKAIADGLEPEKGPLRIVNYADYVNPDVIADFENLYGVDVEFTTINTDTEVMRLLLAAGADANIPNGELTTPLMVAAGLLGNFLRWGTL